VTGTYANGPVLNQTSGVRDAGTAVAFDGTNDHVAAGDNYDFAANAAFAVELWTRPIAATVNYERLISKEDASAYGWKVELDPNGGSPNRVAVSRANSGGQDRVMSGATLTPRTWYHVAVTYDGTTLELYLNGVMTSVASARSLPDHATPLYLARGDNKYVPAALDEVAIWTSALTAQQVTEHYNAGRR
jgi:hypothetical protein